MKQESLTLTKDCKNPRFSREKDEHYYFKHASLLFQPHSQLPAPSFVSFIGGSVEKTYVSLVFLSHNVFLNYGPSEFVTITKSQIVLELNLWSWGPENRGWWFGWTPQVLCLVEEEGPTEDGYETTELRHDLCSILIIPFLKHMIYDPKSKKDRPITCMRGFTQAVILLQVFLILLKN